MITWIVVGFLVSAVWFAGELVRAPIARGSSEADGRFPASRRRDPVHKGSGVALRFRATTTHGLDLGTRRFNGRAVSRRQESRPGLRSARFRFGDCEPRFRRRHPGDPRFRYDV